MRHLLYFLFVLVFALLVGCNSVNPTISTPKDTPSTKSTTTTKTTTAPTTTSTGTTVTTTATTMTTQTTKPKTTTTTKKPTTTQKTTTTTKFEPIEGAYRLFVNGKEIPNIYGQKIHDKYGYPAANLPLVSIITKLGIKVQWQTETTALVPLETRQGNSLICNLDITNGTLKAPSPIADFLDPPFGCDHAKDFSTAKRELLLNSDSVDSFLHKINFYVNDHAMNFNVSVDEKTNTVRINPMPDNWDAI